MVVSVGIDQGQTQSVKGSVNKGGVSQCLLTDQVNRFCGIPVMTAIWCQRQHFPLVIAVIVSHCNLCKYTTFICWLPHNWLRLNHPIHFLPFRMGGSCGALVEVVDWWGVREREPLVEHLDVLSPGHPRQLVSCCCWVLCTQALPKLVACFGVDVPDEDTEWSLSTCSQPTELCSDDTKNTDRSDFGIMPANGVFFAILPCYRYFY